MPVSGTSRDDQMEKTTVFCIWLKVIWYVAAGAQ
jgi:hypothetical protein